MPVIVYNSTAFNTNKKRTFLDRQRLYITNNELEKAIAMQYIDQHNATVILRKQKSNFKKIIQNLHSNQKNLVGFFLEKDYLNEDQAQFLQNIIIDLRLSCIEHFPNLYE